MKIHIHPVCPTSHSAMSHYKPGDVGALFIISHGEPIRPSVRLLALLFLQGKREAG